MVMEVFLLIAGGAIAGFINTLSGSGSAITLPLLIQMIGLDPLIANGTNRIGIFLQSGLSSYKMTKSKTISFKKHHYAYICSAVLGAILGVFFALNISKEGFTFIFKYLLLFILIIIILNPKKLLEDRLEEDVFRPLLLIGFFILGVYGGFIQMGMGVLFIVYSVLLAKFPITKANVTKLLTITIYTFIALMIFIYNDQVNWKYGLILSLGQVIGAFIGSSFFLNHPNAKKWTYRLLIITLLTSTIKSFLYT